MHQLKISFDDSQLDFLGKHKHYGFRDRSELTRAAVELLRQQLLERELEESARLYNEIYDSDPESQAWVEDAMNDWPV